MASTHLVVHCRVVPCPPCIALLCCSTSPASGSQILEEHRYERRRFRRQSGGVVVHGAQLGVHRSQLGLWHLHPSWWAGAAAPWTGLLQGQVNLPKVCARRRCCCRRVTGL